MTLQVEADQPTKVPTADDVAAENHQSANSDGPREVSIRHMVISGQITPHTYRHVRQLISDKSASADAVMVWLETVGGSPNDGYRVMLELKHRYGSVAVVVASEAYSTGTMMALGADVLFMGPSAILGPLDMQIPHPARPTGNHISTLDVLRAMDAIENRAQNYGMSIATDLATRAGFGLVDAVKEGFAASTTLYRPLVEQIDPYLLHSSVQELSLGIRYTAGLLASRRDIEAEHRLDARTALTVAEKLATEFNTHSHAIRRDDLATFDGITPHPAEKIPGWEAISGMICGQLSPNGMSNVAWLIDGPVGGDSE